jgi:uncharacterized protein YegP (UPF0339 family)
MSASDLKFIIVRDVNDGYWWRLRSADGETIELSEKGHQDKPSCRQEVQHQIGDKYPGAQMRDASVGSFAH